MKQLNFLIKFVKKNLYLVLFISFLIIFGLFQLNIGALSSSDFTLTNAKLFSNNIQLSNLTHSYSTQFSLNSVALSQLYSVSSSYAPSSQYLSSGLVSTFCNGYGGSFLSSSAGVWGYSYGLQSSQWVWYDRNVNKYVQSVTCEFPSLATSGNIEQTLPITTTQPYTHFSLEYNVSLNGGTVIPYLIVGTSKHYFTNKVLDLPQVVSDTQLKVGFDLTGSSSVSPQLNNNIVLSGSLGSTPTSSGSSSQLSSSSNAVIKTLKATSSKVSSAKGTVNKLATYISNVVFNSLKFVFHLVLSPFGL